MALSGQVPHVRRQADLPAGTISTPHRTHSLQHPCPVKRIRAQQPVEQKLRESNVMFIVPGSSAKRAIPRTQLRAVTFPSRLVGRLDSIG
jgi:hypothetical protein